MRSRMKCFVSDCPNLATCAGVYEDPDGPIECACDDHCGHGNEDGWCMPIQQAKAAARAGLLRRDDA